MRSNEEIVTIIENRMKEKGLSMSELARRVNMAKSALSRYFNRTREFPLNRVNEFAKVLNLTPEYILGFDEHNEDINTIYNQLEPPRQAKVYNYAESQLESQNKVVSIGETHFDDDYVGQTAAGAPIEGQQPVPMLGSDTVKLLVNGDSMQSLFHDGDIVEYHPQPELENGEIGVFAVNGGITMKKFRKNDDVRLESLNKKYEDIIIKETDDFSILGKIIL